MNTLTTADTFLFIDHGNAKLIVSNGIYRTFKFTGAFQMCDRTGRTCLCTLTALLTFICIYTGTMLADRDRSKIAGANTCLADTVLTVICYHITGDRTILTCGTDDLNDISGILCAGCLSLCKADTLANDLSLLINTAAELRRRSGDQIHWNMISRLL